MYGTRGWKMILSVSGYHDTRGTPGATTGADSRLPSAMWRRIGVLTAFAVGSVGSLMSAAVARAEDWKPQRPIRMVLGYTPGGAADAVARDLAPVMEKVLGQPVVVDYRPGAGGAIGVEAVANAPADGLTIGLIDGAPLTIIPNARKVNYDPVRSLSYLGIVSRSPLAILVNPSVPANSLQELLALARANPDSLTYATSGIGTIHQMSSELLQASTQVSMLHVPYKGAAPALTDVMAGAVKVSFSTISPAAPFVKAGKLRALAVTSDREVALLPGVKTVASQGVAGYNSEGWFVMAAPKGLPAPIAAKLNEAINAALTTPAIQQKFAEQGSSSDPSTPAEAAELVKRDYRKWGEVIRTQHLTFD